MSICFKYIATLLGQSHRLRINSHRITGHLGSGQFGYVDQGICKTENNEARVALKTLNQGSADEDKVKFLQEAAIMAQFRHPNVVFLYGMVCKEEPVSEQEKQRTSL